MKIDKKFVFSLMFNIAETLLIFLIGKFLSLPISNILIVMLTFMISRGCFGKALHFKTWYRCLVWSSIIMLSLFLFLKIDLILSVLFAIFSAFIMTGKSNIRDMYLWTGKVSKYDALKNFVAISPNHPILLEHEEYWKEKEEVYKMRYYGDNRYNDDRYGDRAYETESSYGRRGVPGTGRGRGRYRGPEGKMHEAIEHYGNYSEASEEANRGNYGAEQDSIKALECMLEAVCDFMEMLERDAGSQEESQMIKKYARKIGEM